MNDTVVRPDPAQVAGDFRNAFQDSLSTDQVNQGVAQIESTTTGYAANGSVASLVLWTKCQCSVNNGKTFNGSSWGIAFPGGGALFGTVYTDDINALYNNTASFAFTGTSVYTAFYFFDGDHNPLGSFQAGSISTVTGTGGGSGSWS